MILTLSIQAHLKKKIKNKKLDKAGPGKKPKLFGPREPYTAQPLSLVWKGPLQ